MASSKLRKAIGAVKDQTSIGLAKVISSATISDLEVAVVKATRHQECPPDKRHVQEILHLTAYSRAFVSCCIDTIARRLDRTKNWVVALKALMLIQRLCTVDDPAYEQEIFLANKRGMRLLNLSNFRDASGKPDARHFTRFVRRYALYLDEYLEFRKHKESGDMAEKATPIKEMKIDAIFSNVHHHMCLLDRFLACRPAGPAKDNKLVQAALHLIVVESFQLYHDTTKLLEELIDRFIELQTSDMVRIHEIFSQAAMQYDELDALYDWSRTVGIVHTSEYPDVEKISLKKLDMMGEFIREKSTTDAKWLAEPSPEEAEPQENSNFSKALLLPEEIENEIEEKEEIKEVDETNIDQKVSHEVPDLLTIGGDESSTQEPHYKMALTLFDTSQTKTNPKSTTTNSWEAFEESSGEDWESVLAQPSSHKSNHNAMLPVGFNTLILYSMYEQGARPPSDIMPMGSAGNMVLGLTGTPVMLGGASTSSSSMNNNPFTGSLAVAPPAAYVQMPSLDMKQSLLAQEQLMWQQYQQRNGMQGQFGLAKVPQSPYQFNTEGYSGIY